MCSLVKGNLPNAHIHRYINFPNYEIFWLPKRLYNTKFLRISIESSVLLPTIFIQKHAVQLTLISFILAMYESYSFILDNLIIFRSLLKK
jgi:hypothetical protein